MTVQVCREKDIECGRSPSRWCDTCPQWTAHLVDETEPGWAFKNVAAPSDLKIGDYVFASRWSDADPGDPWNVGYVRWLGPNWVLVEGHGFSRRYPNAMRITNEQAERILARYPALEGCRKIPYKEIYEIFNGPSNSGCSTCGIAGIHACLGAPIEPWTEEKMAKLTEVFAMYPPMRPKAVVGALSADEKDSNPLVYSHSMNANITAGASFPSPTFDDIESVKQEMISSLKKAYTDLDKLKHLFAVQGKQASAFVQIRELVMGADQDGVLAKIRALVNNV